ncbi:hypothetical protein H312_00315 [Anncaliia algerae PRA339]|uniref:Uncharacterized protein n=1 Tax=Anncaliia algerae PRA339 TaxID=1288291 RepID=A0A059F5A8_9MICR|nr:hypothetical protein H312_00315 [Anncaliia algerae PRA339]
MKNKITIFQLQIDSFIDEDTPYIIIHGLKNEKPIKVIVTDFLPYLYIEAPKEDIKDDLLYKLTNSLSKGKVSMITESYKYKLYGYSTEKVKFIKYFLQHLIP